jgi:hypothetical protein
MNFPSSLTTPLDALYPGTSLKNVSRWIFPEPSSASFQNLPAQWPPTFQNSIKSNQPS